MTSSTLDELIDSLGEKRPRGPDDAGLVVLVPHHEIVHEIEQRLLDRGFSTAGIDLMTAAQCIRRIANSRIERDELTHGNLASWLEREIQEQLANLIAEDVRRELRYLARHDSARRQLLSTLLTLRRIEAAYGLTYRGSSARAQIFLSLLPPLASAVEASQCDDAAARIARLGSASSTQTRSWPRSSRVLVYAPSRREAPELAALLRALEQHGTQIEIVADKRFTDAKPIEREDVSSSAARRPRAELKRSETKARLETFSAQGIEAELVEALRRIRELLRGGMRADRIAITAVRPRDYAGRIVACAKRESVPIANPPRLASRAKLAVQLATKILRLLERGPRALFITTMRHPLLAFEAAPQSVLADLELFDHQSRAGGAARGLEHALRFAPTDETSPVRRFLESLIELREARNSCRTNAELAALLSRYFETWIRSEEADLDDARGHRAIRAALDDLEVRDRLEIPTPNAETSSLADLFESLLPESGPADSTRDGVPWLALDAHDGRDFDAVFLLGMQRNAFPPPPEDHPHLGHDDLAELRDRIRGSRNTRADLQPEWRCPIPLQPGEAAQLAVEDLEAWLHQCSTVLTVSHRRADEVGKPLTPSPWIGAIAAALGRPRQLSMLFADEDTHQSIAWEPKRRSAHRLRSTPSTSDVLLHAGLHGGPLVLADVARKIESPLAPKLERAAAWLDAVDSFETRAGRAHRHDPLNLGPSNVLERGISVSSFETLATCPLQFYFKTILRARTLPQEPSYEATSSLGVGNAAHEICEIVYARVFESERDLEDRIENARRIVDQEVERKRDYFTAPLERELTKLGQHVLESWRGALANFVEADLRKLSERGLRPQRVEQEIEATIRVGSEDAPIRIAVRGKIDRFDAPIDGANSASKPRVVDYKTGKTVHPDRDLSKKVRALQHTQLPIYALMVEETTGVLPDASLFGIAPQHQKLFGARFPELGIDPSVWLERDKLLREFGTHAQKIVDGAYVLQENTPFPCNYCDFRSACPRHHPPTKERLRRFGDAK